MNCFPVSDTISYAVVIIMRMDTELNWTKENNHYGRWTERNVERSDSFLPGRPSRSKQDMVVGGRMDNIPPYGVTDLPPSVRFRSCATGAMQIRQHGVGFHNRVDLNYLCSRCKTWLQRSITTAAVFRMCEVIGYFPPHLQTIRISFSGKLKITIWRLSLYG